MIIHREGRVLLFVLLVVLFALNWAISYFLPQAIAIQNISIGISIVFYLLILQFFRSPVFTINQNEKHVIAPADGKVVVIEEADEPEYLKSRRKQISIFMSPVNVHVNRMPVGGTISYFKYHPGKYLVAWHPKSSTENERTTVATKMPNGTEVLFRQIAGALARRIKWYVQQGQTLKQGDEFGFIKFGSRVDIFLPLDAKINVKIGDVTKGGRTVIAEL
ncbi:MAG: phosphatidylserine decarboxylase family protein [Bacteroidota bacterium]|jgi:phosphatidylserine decarboxylase|nr:phosphatidylserine decarboxylase family protein [Bacteroidota bacterium]MCA4898799.1 phosphatidylserine decarboxylase family protein [Cytophagales bacterium]MCE2957340.1 phosphatidylserine decarboxylase family protein [Flammeovirgaceae bacterium]MCZ8068763.1 phosphatidylserine decarboxylase family protein [Cytophagales bacterium]